MRKILGAITMIMFISMLAGAAGGEVSRKELWKQVKEATDKGLPKTAVKHLNRIYQLASNENDMADAVKALTKRIVMEGNIQGNKPEEKIVILQDETDKADPRVKPLLKVVLARWYWHYYNRNRWRFMNRSTTEGLENDDFTTWDLPKLFAHIGSLYDEVLKNQDVLAKTPITSLEGFLEMGNVPLKLRPTLFDFFAHDALAFYTSDDQSNAKPVMAFEVDASSPIFAPVDKFLLWKPETIDVNSGNYKAVRILQHLIAHNRETMNLDGELDNDLIRIHWGGKISVGDNVSGQYMEALEYFVKHNSSHSSSALAYAYIARQLYKDGEYVKALAICNDTISNWPKAYGSSILRSIKNDILEKSVYMHTEKILRLENSEVMVTYKNIDKVYFRLYKREEKELFSTEQNNPESISWDEYSGILKRNILKEWQESIDPGSDYREKTALINLPSLEPGIYYLAASVKKNFQTSDNCIMLSPVIVSDIALTSRRRGTKIEVFINDAETGEPLQRVQVERHAADYKRDKYRWNKIDSEVTDSNGRAFFAPDDHYGFYLVRRNGQILYKTERFNGNYQPSSVNSTSVKLFTDRSIYRPGQMVYYKGVLIHYRHKDNKYETLADSRIDISFIDPNGQNVKTETHSTNEYGSFSGVFTAPSDRLTGNYTLRASNNGYTSVRVEEYKRPKFTVSVEKPDKSYRLEDMVEVKGSAMAYTGAAIDGASVKYRVVREVRMPRWCWWYVPRSTSQEIAHGTASTDVDGSFRISFTARPDRSIPRENEPVFDYKIHADVTDSTGETRSASQNIRVGYTAMTANVGISSRVEAGQKVSAVISTKTHDGTGVSAKGKITVHVLKQPVKTPRKPYFSGGNLARQDMTDIRNWQDAETIMEKVLETSSSGTQTLNLDFKEGAYRIRVETSDRFGNKVIAQNETLVIDKKSPKFSLKLPFIFWSPSRTLEPGETFKAMWATGYNSGPAFIEVEHRGRLLKEYWTEPGAAKNNFEIPVTEEMRGGFIVRVFMIKENREYSHNAYIAVPWSNKDLNIEFTSMKSKMQPAEKTVWSVKITGDEAEKNAIEMLAAMYDASLDAFAPHSWPGTFEGFYRDGNRVRSQFANQSMNMNTWVNDLRRGVAGMSKIYPSLPSYIVNDFMQYEFMRYSAMPSAALSRSKSLGDFGENSFESMADGIEGELMAKSSSGREMKKESEDKQTAGASDDESSATEAEEVNLDAVKARSNLNETAFFYPHLIMDGDNSVQIEFTIPEALTTWKFMGFAHGKTLQSGTITAETVTQKDLMVQPNPPRFLREGDRIRISAKITNMSEEKQSGKIRLKLEDPVSLKGRNADFQLEEDTLSFTVPAGESRAFEWPLDVPDTPGMVKYTIVASSGNLSDGEEGMLPILTRRIFVTESLPLPIRGPADQKWTFEKLVNSKDSDSLEHQALTVDMTSNPAWYAVQALPYLMEFPHECSEQLFNRIYANLLARFIAASDPKIKRVFDAWKADERSGGKALFSNLEKNEHLKSVALLETPWVLDAQNENQQKHRIGILFDSNRVNSEIKRGMNKLSNMQKPDGGFPWFPGGRTSSYITLYIMTGFGRLRNMDIAIDKDVALKTLNHLDRWINKMYRDIIKHKGYEKEVHINSTVALYLYGRSFFIEDKAIPESSREAFDFFLAQAKKHWLKVNNRQSQGHIALALVRLGERAVAEDIVASIRERSVHDDELGMFWRENELSWWWYRAEIETQAVMIEMFDEVAGDAEAVEECKIWMLKQKQTQSWKTTKSTADAVYALLRRGANLLASDKLVKIYLGGNEVKPEKVEAGTGHYQKIYSGAEVKPEMGDIRTVKEDKGIAWGAVHWQYLEDMSKITPHETNLKLKKSLFVKANTDRGEVMSPVKGNLQVGDLVVVRIELRTDRDMEFVHMKDGRGSGMEPVNVISRYRYQDGLRYYEATKDTASHFYIDYLPKGVYVFEYELRVQHKGTYQTGMAEIQCMYAPEFNSHSESFMLNIK